MNYTPEEEKLREDFLNELRKIETFLSVKKEEKKLTDSRVDCVRTILICNALTAAKLRAKLKAQQKASQPPPTPPPSPPPRAANPSSKSKKKRKKKKKKKQASKQQTQDVPFDVETIEEAAEVETIEALKKEISLALDLLKICQNILKAGKVKAGKVKAGNRMRGQVRAGNISEQAVLGSISLPEIEFLAR